MTRVVVALFLLALAAAASASGGSGSAHFPLAAGNRWTLEDDDGRLNAISVGDTAASGLILRGFPGTRDLRVRLDGRTVEAWDGGQNRWEPFLRLGAAAGTTYTVNLSDVVLWRNVRVTVASRTAVLHDARERKLEDCVRLTFRYGKGIADAGIEELVFAPGVGIVRTTVQTIAGPRVSLLRSYRLA